MEISISWGSKLSNNSGSDGHGGVIITVILLWLLVVTQLDNAYPYLSMCQFLC